jgi:uncharacterized protein (DUF433 family)
MWQTIDVLAELKRSLISEGTIPGKEYEIIVPGRPPIAKESIDWTECPLVEVKPGVQSGAPVLLGTRMPVDAIVDNFDYGLSVAEIAEQFEIPQNSIEAILTYASRRRRNSD